MDAIDKLMDSNDFNFRVMAMVPAVFCVWVVRKGVRMILYSFDGKRKSKVRAKRVYDMRETLLT